MRFIWVSHVMHMDESCLSSMNICMRVIWVSHVRHVYVSCFSNMNESCVTCEWVMSLQCEYTYESHMSESCHAHGRVITLKNLWTMQQQPLFLCLLICMTVIWMSHVSHVNESCLSSMNICMRVIWVSHVRHVYESCFSIMNELCSSNLGFFVL